MKDPDFLEEIDIAQAFEKDFLDLAFNLGFITSHGEDYDKEDDGYW